jgi:serine/threonine protein kinase
MKHWKSCELPDDTLFPEQYSVQEVLRDGVASTIFLGIDRQSNAQIVIKCFKPSAKSNYLREINATFGIQHANILGCLDTFHRADGLACIVYEYLAGGTLQEYLLTHRPVNQTTILTFIQAMLNALIYLHGLKRIHCDIKPENILLRNKNADSLLDFVLIDLGASCLLVEAREGHHVTGTPAYIAPERISNQFFYNSDLYSLGIISYELCTGHRPFTGTLEELTLANRTEMPSLEAIVPPVLRDFIDHILVKNPRERIESASMALLLFNRLTVKTEGLPFKHSKAFRKQYQDKSSIVKYGELQRTIPETLHGMQCFNVNDVPYIGLIFNRHVEVIDPLYQEQICKTLMTAYRTQILTPGKLAYATPSRIQILDLVDFSQKIVREKITDLKLWHIEQDKLVWIDSYHCYYEKSGGQQIGRINLPNYLFSPKICILENDLFVTTEGIASNKIVLRDRDANSIKEWNFIEPIIAMTHDNDIIVAVTMSLDKHKHYTVWRLTTANEKEYRVLPDNISQIYCQNGAVYYLNNNVVLSRCNADLTAIVVCQFANPIHYFAVSYDERFIINYHKTNNDSLLLTIYKDWDS